MNGSAFREQVETAKATQLNRLGSAKLLVALTDATLEDDRVLGVAAHSEYTARETFREWAASEADADARAAFETVRDREADHLERVLEAFEDTPTDLPFDPDERDPNDGGPMHSYLRNRTDTVERVASGMVGRSLVSLRAHTQVIGYFVNEADERRANLFRDLKRETEETLERGLSLLEDRCDTDDDWERASMVAEYVIQIAYDGYADSLSGMGLDPKPLC